MTTPPTDITLKPPAGNPGPITPNPNSPESPTSVRPQHSTRRHGMHGRRTTDLPLRRQKNRLVLAILETASGKTVNGAIAHLIANEIIHKFEVEAEKTAEQPTSTIPPVTVSNGKTSNQDLPLRDPWNTMVIASLLGCDVEFTLPPDRFLWLRRRLEASGPILYAVDDDVIQTDVVRIVRQGSGR